MIKGISITDEGSLVDAKGAKAAGYEFAYLRARKTASGSTASGKDDQKVSQNRAAFAAAGMPFGVFMDFDWRPGVDSAAAVQAAEFAGQCRPDDPLPPGIRLWEITGGPAVTDWYAFARLLAEIVYYLDNKVHRRPVIMANGGQIKSITAAMANLSLDQRTLLSGCWWDPITWSEPVPTLPAPWTKFPFYESSDHKQVVPGATGVAIMRWPGDLVKLQTWYKNPTLDNIPIWDNAVEPPPEGDPETPPAGEVTLKSVSVQLTTLQASLDKLSAHLGGN